MSYVTPEKRVQNKIIEYVVKLENQGFPILHFRRDAIGPNYKKGLPDIYLIVGPYHVEVEVKAPGKSRSTMQEKWGARILNIGGAYWIIDNFNDFVSNLSNILSSL